MPWTERVAGDVESCPEVATSGAASFGHIENVFTEGIRRHASVIRADPEDQEPATYTRQACPFGAIGPVMDPDLQRFYDNHRYCYWTPMFGGRCMW
mmetsp:Transcript_91733/g.201116  ORF Transcript_91733/g.201116 Transcript_91733/m.201116 type:complete len:96 (+) Transcript_91733:289-576(+)